MDTMMNAIEATGRNFVDIDRLPIGRVYRASWVEYVKPMATHGAIIGALMWLSSYAWSASILWAFYVLAILAVMTGLILFYMLAHVHSTRIYANSEGVWMLRGVFPWEVQTFGIRWADAGEAVCSDGILAWLTGSYSVAVLNRHTKTADIWCSMIGEGHYFVGHINALIRRYR